MIYSRSADTVADLQIYLEDCMSSYDTRITTTVWQRGLYFRTFKMKKLEAYTDFLHLRRGNNARHRRGEV